MTALSTLLDHYRNVAVSEREKGTYFEELIVCYLRNEANFRDLYSDVWTYGQWAESEGLHKKDAGIDLVAKTHGTGEIHAIQCKLYAESYHLQKGDIDSFFTASGKKPFAHRVIVSTTNHWSQHAEEALQGQQTPVSKIDLNDLENSQIDWSQYHPKALPTLKPKKELRDHQSSALRAVIEGLLLADRGKMIMACGTGKTFTSLKIAEAIAGAGKRVLFLVPSLSLLSQSLTEWTQESMTPLHSFAVCSDTDVGKKRKKDDDTVQTYTHELRFPATTDAQKLATEMGKRHDSNHMSVVFSTYHSIATISDAQKLHGLADFDLIVCDEAHRTTGATFSDAAESKFVKVHDADYLRSSKRIYMTATPRIYGDNAKATAERDDVALCSMDDESLYGKELYVITFSEAVRRKLLVDYKVIVLAVDENHINRRLQKLLNSSDNQLKVDDAAKIIGCWKALAKQGDDAHILGDVEPMKRAVAFCQVIEPIVAGKDKEHKVSSKTISDMFQMVVEAYQKGAEESDGDDANTIEAASWMTCEASHVDGGMNASQREAELAWLKADAAENTCRILSNVRCLSEGVDVPSLDAVLFLTPRNSQVDVVQSVGRVMRNAPGKTRGYVVLPVVIPAHMEAHEALDDNKVYAVVWQVLQALRSHDDSFDASVNKLDLIGKDPWKMEVIAITDKIQKKSRTPAGEKKHNAGKGKFQLGETVKRLGKEDQVELEFEIGDIERAIYAKLVKKVGNPNHWEEWANDIAKIAGTHINRIKLIVENESNIVERKAFFAFADKLRDDLNKSISDGEIIEMLAQHLITKPVFDALFSEYSFAQYNPMSKSMQAVLDALQEHHLDKEADTLQRFYDSVKLRAKGIENAAGKQKIVVELYDKFFRNAFPKMTKRLGIVYTPVEVVDFIIHSVDHILKTEFEQTLGSDGVHIIDPFTGTGTFITRLMQSGLIGPEQLPQKYKSEIHANELVLLAYYIAAINIESVYHSIVGGDYVPFEGICLTDTFQMYEKEDLVDELLLGNSARRNRQKKLKIKVIMGNPPYSIGQVSQKDNNPNADYPHSNQRIIDTYATRSTATLSKGLYDSYIRAIRWASDRVGQSGVVGYVSGSGFAEKPAMDGLRQCLADEFSSIYVLNLRGDIRKNMLSKGLAQEGQNIFGSGSMTGIAITLFVKNPNAKQQGQIFHHDIGDDLTTVEKLDRLNFFVSVAGIAAAEGWNYIIPDKHGDWVGQRNVGFSKHIVLGDKKNGNEKLFENYSLGVATNRDAWCYNNSALSVIANMSRMIDFYNQEVNRFARTFAGLDKKSREKKVDGFLNPDPAKISWTRGLKQELVMGRTFEIDTSCLTTALYRPFTKQSMYFSRHFNEMVLQMPRIFPNATAKNLVICVSGVGARSGFSALMADALPSLDTIEKGQCFPLRIFEEIDAEDPRFRDYSSRRIIDVAVKDVIGVKASANRIMELFADEESQRLCDEDENPYPNYEFTDDGRYLIRDGITDVGLSRFLLAYPSQEINKENVFYYIYGLLHSPDYRERYADNLSKELPHIPCVKTAIDFWAFSHAGRELANLHLNYETVKLYPVTIGTGGKTLADADYRVEKMKYGKNGKDKDLTTLQYNAKITLTKIPLEAYEYVVNGKPALDWVVDRQRVKTDKDSGIVNDANDWATEMMNNVKYPLELFQRVITVSLETMRIVKTLPSLDISI